MSCVFLMLRPVDNVTGEVIPPPIGKVININRFEKVQSFKYAKNYLFSTLQFENIHDAVVALACDKTQLPVLGTFSPDVSDYINNADVCLPRWKLKNNERSITTITDSVDNKCVLEFDNVVIENFHSSEPAAALKPWLRQRGIMCDVTYQLSASQRVNSDEPKLHVFFEYEQDYPLASRKCHAVSLGSDGSIYNGVNPLYIAPPQFVDDDNRAVNDPLPNRIGFIKGQTRKLAHMPDIKKMERYLKPRGYAVVGNFIDKISLTYADIEKAKRAIESGDDYHNAHLFLSLHYANNRLSAIDIESLIMQSMLKVKNQDDRWQVRCDELPGICASAVEVFQRQVKTGNDEHRVVSEYVEIGNEIFTNVDWPPGFLGILAREIWEMMHYPNQQIAIISAHVLIVNFSGRKNSFRGIDMSRSYELLARTGVGKDTPRWAIEKMVDALSRRFNFLEYLGLFHPLGRSFGTSALLRSCRAQLSVMIIQSEGGISNKSSSGDQSTVKSFVMQNQSSAAYERMTTPDYSKQMPSVYGVSLTVLYESTRESHVSRGEIFETGEAGRLNKFHCSHKVDDIQRNKRETFSVDVLNGVKNLYLEAVRAEDFNFEVVIGKEIHVGASLTRVPGNERVHFRCTQDVDDRFKQINDAEITRRNASNQDSEREWAENSRYEFRVMKECLILAYADAGAKAKNAGDNEIDRDEVITQNEPPEFELEARETADEKAAHSQNAMSSIAMITKQHLDYAESYIKELDRADRANASDYNPDDVVLIALIESYCQRLFSKKIDDMPKLFVRKMGGTKKAGEFFQRKIIFKSCLMSDSTSRFMKHISKMCATSNVRDAHRVIESAFRSGESEGRWVFMKANHSGNIYRVDLIQFAE